jgi:hypothetical protein
MRDEPGIHFNLRLSKKQETLPHDEAGSLTGCERLLVFLGVLLFESFHTAFGIDNLLRTCKEGVATGTNINIDVSHR